MLSLPLQNSPKTALETLFQDGKHYNIGMLSLSILRGSIINLLSTHRMATTQAHPHSFEDRDFFHGCRDYSEVAVPFFPSISAS